jgi:predicted amidohydrolase YtcJ
MLIRGATLIDGRAIDVRVTGTIIADLGHLAPLANEPVIEASGGCLLPGLHDHHIHLRATAAALDSVRCGPPDVGTEEELRCRLVAAATASPTDWIRGTGYHPSVAGEIDRHWLDRVLPNTPVRIQHRSGRLWILNTPAIAILERLVRDVAPDALSTLNTTENGRYLDQDTLFAATLGHRTLPIATTSRQLASRGITGITDMNPGNGPEDFQALRAWQRSGDLMQHAIIAGRESLSGLTSSKSLAIGPLKVHLHDHDLPELETFINNIRTSHEQDRPVAVHCVTDLALIFTVAAFESAGTIPGDRIEHASVTPDEMIEPLHRLGLIIVTQPHFIRERGRDYLQGIPAAEHHLLYRCRVFLERGVALAGGTDAPFGAPDPWASMHAAVHRITADGVIIGPDERLTPEEALALFTGRPERPDLPRRIAVGERADLCLLDHPWSVVRQDLNARHVKSTFIGGVPFTGSRR